MKTSIINRNRSEKGTEKQPDQEGVFQDMNVTVKIIFCRAAPS